MISNATSGRLALVLLLVFVSAHVPASGEGARLRVVTINAWSGLEYRESGNYAEYETPERREERFALLVDGLKRARADVIFVQEANPVGRFASRLASRLGFDEIHQVTNAGFKLGPLGSPGNLKEGLATLARPTLRLRESDVWKLSGSFGIYGDPLSIHSGESAFALVGKIYIAERPFYLVNTRLSPAPELDSALRRQFLTLAARGDITDHEAMAALEEAAIGMERRMQEATGLAEHLRTLPPSPVIVGGDFNATPGSPELLMLHDSAGYLDSYPDRGAAWGRSWSVEHNRNSAYATAAVDADGDTLDPYRLLQALDDRRSRRSDGILLSSHFFPEDILESSIVLEGDSARVQPSDHFGVMTDLRLDRLLAGVPREPLTVVPPADIVLDGYPILSWDPDAGFGYGAGVKAVNMLGGAESLGLLLFGSNRGERHYRIGLSIPDAEFRWGKKFAVAVDVGVDFDRREQMSFFGVGSGSRLSDLEHYTRDAFELFTTIGSAVFPQFVAETGWRYRRIVNSGFNDTSRLERLPPATNAGSAVTTSIHLGARYDTRERLRNPTFGTVIRLEGELGPQVGITNVSFSRVSLWLQGYRRLWHPRTILAGRIGFQNMTGEHIPAQLLLSLGGATTLRGYSANRFVDRTAALLNGELRLPIWDPVGGVIGLDAGKVWSQVNHASLAGWETSGVLGLRLYLEQLVVRLDAGFGREGTAVYFGIGEVF